MKLLFMGLTIVFLGTAALNPQETGNLINRAHNSFFHAPAVRASAIDNAELERRTQGYDLLREHRQNKRDHKVSDSFALYGKMTELGVAGRVRFSVVQMVMDEEVRTCRLSAQRWDLVESWSGYMGPERWEAWQTDMRERRGKCQSITGRP